MCSVSLSCYARISEQLGVECYTVIRWIVASSARALRKMSNFVTVQLVGYRETCNILCGLP